MVEMVPNFTELTMCLVRKTDINRVLEAEKMARVRD